MRANIRRYIDTELRILPITGIGEIAPGIDLGTLLFEALQAQELAIQQGDIFVVTQKIVSKAEGRVVNLEDVQPSEFARKFAEQYNKDPQHVEVVLRESSRIVRMDHGVLIAETKHGFICANAGVDESNVNGARQLTLLPDDSDRSARILRRSLQQLAGQDENFDIAVIISDTWGRPWRSGQVNMAIGVAGMEPLADYRGRLDPYGYELHASIIAIADEVASAAELVMGKIDRVPAAIIRGYAYTPGEGSVRTLLRDASTDMFR
jgi:coenzyme F420-0:L-glutamate ligase/coenzyme F420-1:gamma-L-glutamate ligase